MSMIVACMSKKGLNNYFYNAYICVASTEIKRPSLGGIEACENNGREIVKRAIGPAETHQRDT